MKSLILLFILAITLAQRTCGNDDTVNYRLFTIELTGNLIGNPANSDIVTVSPTFLDPQTSDILPYTSVCGFPVTDAANFVTGNCPTFLSYTAQQIKAGTAKINLCLVSETADNASIYDYLFTIDSSAVRGFCVKVSDYTSKNYYTGVCYQTVGSYTQAFSVSEIDTVNLYTPSINRITETIFVDAFTPTEIRPEIALTLNNDNTIGGATASVPGNYLTALSFEGETALGLQFIKTDYIFSGKVLVSTFEKKTSFTIRTGPEDEPNKVVNIEKFDCTNAGEYPVLVTRVHNGNTLREVFTLKNSQGELVGDTIDVNDQSTTGWGRYLRNTGSALKGLVAEYAVCLPKDDYTLELYTLRATGTGVLTTAWTSDSYVTFSTLSEQREGETAYTGYIVGDFAFTSSAGSTSNTLTIHLGPVDCAENQRVVVFDKLATTNGGTEGFEIFKRDDITGEYAQTAMTQYYGLANFLGGRFDPYFRVFLCLDQSTYRIRLRNKQRANVACTAWSTGSSVEQITYTKLDGSVVESQAHPSMFKASILTSNTYYGGEFQLDTSIEGEYYSVLNNPSSPAEHNNDIKSTSDCYFDFDLFVQQSVNFDVYDDSTLINAVTVGITDAPVITHFLDDITKLNLRCAQDNGACVGITGYTMQCYSTSSLSSAVACSNYGLSVPTTIEDLTRVTLTGAYTNSGPTTFYIQFVPTITDTNKYIITTKAVGVTLLNKVACNDVIGKQDKDLSLENTFGQTVDDVKCFDGSVELNKNTDSNSQYSVSIVDNQFQFNFAVSTYDHFTCSIGIVSYNMYIRPTCGDAYNVPTLASLTPSAKTYEEVCDDVTDTTSESYCAYNSILKRASLVKMISVCHRNRFEAETTKLVPAGSSYTKVVFEVVARDNAEQYNIVPSSFWFKEQILFAITEVSTTPVSDVYVTKIDFSNEAGEYSNLLEVVFDTVYDSANDAQLMFYETSFMDAVNAKLMETTQYFWSVYKLEVNDAFAKARADVCYELTDSGVDYSYYETVDATEQKVATVDEITYPDTILYYYGYSAFTSVDGTVFDGAVTRYCRSKYYESLYKDYTTNSYNQYIAGSTNKWSDIHLKIVIENMDPRGASSDIQYALARAFLRFIGHPTGFYFEHLFEDFDVNVFMIKGEVPDEAQPGVYKNTAFYTELRFRNEEQKTYFLEYLDNTIYAVQGEAAIVEAKSDAILTFINYFVGKSFKTQFKAVYMYNLH
ncbi:hypothetical protein WA158_007207 [Blastocystis sp. Blastoise]